MTVQSKISETASHPDAQTVTMVRHWTDRLFSFRVTRPRSLRFRSGEFVMIGLPQESGKPLLRAYSIASPTWDDELEFFSIKVPDGPLTSRLQKIHPGDEVIVRPKPTGTLVLDALLPGRRLWMISTGTGIAPFAALARDPETYEKFEQVILTHTCRTEPELDYGRDVVAKTIEDPLIGEFASDRLTHFASVTREGESPRGRITDLIESGDLFERTGQAPLDPESDRVMLCGSTAFITDMKALLEARGFEEGANSRPAGFVIEKAFVG